MVRTELLKGYYAGDFILRIPGNSGVQQGMRMKITSLKNNNAETFVVYQFGSIKLKTALANDYELGSSIVQTHLMPGELQGSDSPVSRAVTTGRRHDEGDQPTNDDDDDRASLGGVSVVSNGSDLSVVDALFRNGNKTHKII